MLVLFSFTNMHLQFLFHQKILEYYNLMSLFFFYHLRELIGLTIVFFFFSEQCCMCFDMFRLVTIVCTVSTFTLVSFRVCAATVAY